MAAKKKPVKKPAKKFDGGRCNYSCQITVRSVFDEWMAREWNERGRERGAGGSQLMWLMW